MKQLSEFKEINELKEIKYIDYHSVNSFGINWCLSFYIEPLKKAENTDNCIGVILKANNIG